MRKRSPSATKQRRRTTIADVLGDAQNSGASLTAEDADRLVAFLQANPRAEVEIPLRIPAGAVDIAAQPAVNLDILCNPPKRWRHG